MQLSKLGDVHQYLETNDRYLILMHIKPDGDALGSAYALLKYLIKLGKSAIVGIEEDIFYKYQSFFPLSDISRYFIIYSEIQEKDFKHIIVVDTSNFSLLGMFRDLVLSRMNRVLFIDHHISTDSLEESVHYVKQVSSTSEIIFDLIGIENLDFPMAKALYMGIVYDTGQFRHSSANYEVFSKISRLLERFDINKEDTYYYLFENETLERKKLEGSLSSRIRLFADGKIAVCYLTLGLVQDLAKEGTHLSENDMMDLTSIPHSLKGVMVSVMMREKQDHITFSFRSRCEFNMASFATRFGGGGHKKAAGLKLSHMTEQEILNTILLPLQEAFLKWQSQQG